MRTRPPRSAIMLAASLSLAMVGVGAYTLTTRAPTALPVLPAPADNARKAHLPFGPVNPRRPAPPLALTLDDGSTSDLTDVMQGKWRLVQLIFTNCATTCPLQGAIFQRTQQLLNDAGLDVGLLSVSIDADHDDPRALKGWISTFNAGKNWRAAVASSRDSGALLDFFNGRKSGLDVHDARVYFIDPEGRLAYASEDLPDPNALVSLVKQAP